MSTLAVNTITNAAGGNTATINGMTPTAQSLQGFRNRIINGNMVIDQRNAGAAVTPTGYQYTVDRWAADPTAASKFSVQQNAGSVTPPAGFRNYLGITSLSAYSASASDYFALTQTIEGFNVADLNFGTANASTFTISFWVRSSLTGTFGGSLLNSGASRGYVFSYTINAANTWEFKTVTVAGDQSGSWATTNGNGIQLNFSIGAGSNWIGSAGAWGGSRLYAPTGQVSVVGTNGATFYITGVQLEAGSVATPFEQIDYGRELMLCQRYCFAFGDGYRYIGDFTNNVGGNATNAYFFTFPTTMRAAPTFSANGATIAGSFGSGVQYTTPAAFTYTILRSGFNWETAGLLQTGNYLFTAEL
jgi:hypothetical protein